VDFQQWHPRRDRRIICLYLRAACISICRELKAWLPDVYNENGHPADVHNILSVGRGCSAFALPPRKPRPFGTARWASCASSARWSNPGVFAYLPAAPNKNGHPADVHFYLAEREGFEPSIGYSPTPDFESGTFNRSATSPRASILTQSLKIRAECFHA